MDDYVLVTVIEVFGPKTRIEVLDHRGNFKRLPFFERVVSTDDLFEIPEPVEEKECKNVQREGANDIVHNIQLDETQLRIAEDYVNTLLTQCGKRTRNLFNRMFRYPSDLNAIKVSGLIDTRYMERNIGTGTIDEVNSIISLVHQKIIEVSMLDQELLAAYESPTAKLRKVSFTELQVTLCKLYCQHQINQRNKRVKDLYTQVFGHDLDVNKLLTTDIIHPPGHKYLIGKSTVTESNVILQDVQNKAVTLQEMTIPELKVACLYYHLQEIGYSFSNTSEDEFVDASAEKNFLQLLTSLLQSEIFLKPNQLVVLNSIFLADDDVTLEELGKQMDLTRERVRQLKWTLFELLPGLIRNAFFPLFEEDCRKVIFSAGSGQRDIFVISGDYVHELNEGNDVLIGPLGYVTIFQSLLTDHQVIGLDTISTAPRPNPHVQNRYLNYYLIEKRIFKFVDFQALMDAVYERLSYSHLEECHSEDEFFRSFLMKNKTDKRSMATVKELLETEFNILSKDGQVIIPGNRESTVLQLEKILAEAGRPMTLTEIYNEVIDRKIALARSTVHAYLNNNKEKFSLVGWSTFAHVSLNIKSGMIADLIEEYLLREGTPKNLNDIYLEIRKHREIKRQSALLANCGNLPKRFIVKSSIIGLRGRDSVEDLEKLNPDFITREKKWDNNYCSVVSFLKTYRRVPSPRRSGTERSLYNFVSFNKKIFDRLPEERQQKMRAILKLFPSTI